MDTITNLFNFQGISTIIIAGLVIFLAVTLLSKPFRLIFRLLLNTGFGFVALFLLEFLGGGLGISLGINWINALVIGILGLPGVGLLLILQWLMII
ncbi:MAG: pro-sigmaK processing inhibitor BofA family protein [Oscillospiraceae bacterium]|nr:pro-sigmaK processing inhibitor BofA family protein [Oscillospiraceae bacterium]